MAEFDDIRRLPPEERIKRLKAEEEKRKREIEKAEDMIEESGAEIELDEELKRVPIPQIRSLEINDMFFSPTAKWVFEAKKQVQIKPKEEMFPTAEPPKEMSPLEETVEEESRRTQASAQAAGGPQYGIITEMSAIARVYHGIKQVAGNIAEQGYATPQQVAKLESYESAIEKIVQESSPVLSDQRAKGMMVGGKEIITEIRGGYITVKEEDRIPSREKEEQKYKI
jgi:hypothetical protein